MNKILKTSIHIAPYNVKKMYISLYIHIYIHTDIHISMEVTIFKFSIYCPEYLILKHKRKAG